MICVMRIALLIYFLLMASFASAEETGGQITLNPVQLPDEETLPDYGKIAADYIEDIKFYNQKYPGVQIEEDFRDDILEKHPEYSQESAGTNEKFIRAGIHGMRLYSKIKNAIKNFFLETDIPIQVDDDQIAYPTNEVYQESDEPLIIHDFKKVVAYSNDERDKQIMENKASEELDGKTLFQRKSELKKALLEGDWKKLFTHGLFDGKIVDDKRGIGDWSSENGIRIRFLTSTTAADENGKLSGALQVMVTNQGMLLSEKYKQYAPLSVSFDGSENVQEINLNWPIPQRLIHGQKNLIGYWRNIIIPFKLTVEDKDLPLLLKAVLNGVVCGEKKCDSVDVSTEMFIESGQSTETEAASYLRIADIYSTKKQSKKLKITNAFIENNATQNIKPILRIETETSESVSAFDIFVKNEDIGFENPLVRVDGKKVVARFKALEKGRDLLGQSFEVSIRLNQEHSIRQNINAEEISLLDTESGKLSLGLILMALFGGFLLNLMPCVFPVLSLKILSFGKFGARNVNKIKETFTLNLIGIWGSFIILTGFLCALKWLGRAIGWGMQFQNVYFLSGMIFVISAFLAYVWGFFRLPFSGILSKVAGVKVSSGKLVHIINGFFVVLLATPCTAPYLGTAVGFALSGDYLDIVVIMLAVGIGLSTPYWLFAFFPELVCFVPTPGAWMKKISTLMGGMLFLTLIWLLNILYVQTSGLLVLEFSIFICVFWALLWFHKTLIEMVDQQAETVEILQKTKNFFSTISFILIILLGSWAMYLAKSSYDIHRKEISTSSKTNSTLYDTVQGIIKSGSSALVRIGADWCLTCKFNDVIVFDGEQTQEFLEKNNVIMINIDWTNYDEDILNFMKQYGRQGLPFYILFSSKIPEGIVLPEILSDMEFTRMIENLKY